MRTPKNIPTIIAVVVVATEMVCAMNGMFSYSPDEDYFVCAGHLLLPCPTSLPG